MYGGGERDDDQVPAIVLDLGSHSCKAGYAGEDQPKSVFPSVLGSVESSGVVSDGGGDTDTEATKPVAAEKAKAKKLYAGAQALGYRRDHMKV